MAREGSRVVVTGRLSDEFAAVDSRVDAERSRARLVEALQTLSDVDRELVLLAAFSELTYRELADATGLAEGTVRSKLSRAKVKLRERIGDLGEQEHAARTTHLMGEHS